MFYTTKTNVIYAILKFGMIFWLLNCSMGIQHKDEELELMFRERSQSEWKNMWHVERHSRCREQLIRHLFWACEKDIYQLTRRNKKRNNNNNDLMENLTKDEYWFLNDYNPLRLLRTRRSNAHSITSECCSKSCTWEEYAEYCPSNKRKMHF